MGKLYINNIRIELPSNSISRTLQINDLAEVKDRQANYSNNIKIAKTPNNIRVMEFLGITGTKTRLQYGSVKVKYIIDGIELISDGKGVIKNTNFYYNLVIYDGNISMTDLLGDKVLNTLDFSAYNHDLREVLFFNSLSNTDGYIYAFSRYYEFASTNVFNLDLITPSFFVHTLFSMIFEQEGYTVIGDVFSESDFNSRVISMCKGYNREAQTDRDFRGSTSSIITRDDTYLTPTIKEYEISSWTAIDTGVHEVDLSGVLNLSYGENVILKIKKNSTSILASIPIINGAYDITETIKFEDNDVISVHVQITAEFNTPDYLIDFTLNTFKVIYFLDVWIPIDFNELIGKTKRIDFVKDVMQRFSLIFRKTRNKNEFEFIKSKDLYGSNSISEDWTDKYSDFSNESYVSSYAQNNYFRYNYDDSDDDFGDAAITIDNINLTNTKTVVNSIFKASVLTNNKYYIHNHWELKDEVITPVENDGLRVYKILKVVDTILYKFSDLDDSISSFGGEVGLLNFTNYNDELSAYYSELSLILDNYKTIKLKLNLSLIDIYNLDFFKLKYFKQTGKYYYLNKISNFKNNKTTTAELIEVNISAIVTTSMIGNYNGASTYAATLSKLEFGSMTGSYSGSSLYSATLREQTFTEFEMSDPGISEFLVCGQIANTTFWHNGTSALPSLNDIIFEDAAGSIVKIGGALFYKLNGLSYIEILNNGRVISKQDCII